MGLTGGIASGKSTVAAHLRTKGIVVFDMDAIGKELTTADPDIQEGIRSIYGNAVFTPKGLDRKKLRAAVFADPSKRKRLEAIIQPRVRQEFERRTQLEAEKGTPFVVCEAALLIEGGYYEKLDGLTVVVAADPIRIQRLMERDGMSEKLAKSMLSQQTDDANRIRLADYHIRNEGTLDELVENTDQLIHRWHLNGWVSTESQAD